MLAIRLKLAPASFSSARLSQTTVTPLSFGNDVLPSRNSPAGSAKPAHRCTLGGTTVVYSSRPNAKIFLARASERSLQLLSANFMSRVVNGNACFFSRSCWYSSQSTPRQQCRTPFLNSTLRAFLPCLYFPERRAFTHFFAISFFIV